MSEKEYGHIVDRQFGWLPETLLAQELLRISGMSFIQDEYDENNLHFCNTYLSNDEGFFLKCTRFCNDDEASEYSAILKNGDYISFCHVFPEGEEAYFNLIMFRHENEPRYQYIEYHNFEIEEMQQNAPDHELLKAMNKVFEAFADKGSAEKSADESQPAERGESSEMQ